VLVEREVYVREGPRFASLDSWNRRCGEAHAQLFERVRPDVPRLSAWISERFDVLIYADVWSPLCIVAKDNQDADAIQQYLDEYCRQVENLCLVRNDVYARLGHLHFNKGTALAQIGRHAGVHPERVLVAGDHLNDLPMLSPRYARWLVAPANAIPAVKQAVLSAGGHVSPLPCGYGVERALDLLLEDYLEED
jgi:hydroxymethylpyrimidine pyrophosphatase-like HAD family hydrolase